MQKRYKTIHALLACASLGLSQCERDHSKDEQELQVEADCKQLCDALSTSDLVEESSCVDACVDGLDEAEATGEACEGAFTTMLACLGDLGEAAPAWWTSRNLGQVDSYDYPCEDETTSFTEHCPGVWYYDPAAP